MTVSAASSSLPQISDDDARRAAATINRLKRALEAVLFGQERLIEMVIVGLLARGHLLLEGLPGLGKTELVKALSRALELKSSRVQFTPDLLPGDITGNPMLEETGGQRRFTFHQGPVFTNILLADEINRASPKTQSALLEAMQERSVTVMGQTHALPRPFFVLATQNPIELEGTYPLPEAQLDRFLFKLDVPVSGVETLEKIVLNREIGIAPDVPRVLDAHALDELHEQVRRVFMPPPVANLIARLVAGTQPGAATAAGVRFGASPRAALALAAAAKARGLAEGRVNAAYEDVRAVAAPVLRHRVVLDYAARLDGLSPDAFVARLVEATPAHDKVLPTSLADAKV
ncbi:MAG: AAA family ATPase [Planctomycetota bacterium]